MKVVIDLDDEADQVVRELQGRLIAEVLGIRFASTSGNASGRGWLMEFSAAR